MKAGKEVVPDEQHRMKAEDIYVPKQNGGSAAANGFGTKGANGQMQQNGTAPIINGSMGGGKSLDAEYGEDYNPSTGFRDAS